MSTLSDADRLVAEAQRMVNTWRSWPGGLNWLLMERDILSALQQAQAPEQAWRERAEKAEAALAEAAMEINCAGPVAHRIRVLKQEFAEQAQAETTDLVERLLQIANTHDGPLVPSTCREAATRLAGARERGEWAPIETAPTERMVLVCDAASEVFIATRDASGDWRSDEGTPVAFALSCWMPLPALPAPSPDVRTE